MDPQKLREYYEKAHQTEKEISAYLNTTEYKEASDFERVLLGDVWTFAMLLSGALKRCSRHVHNEELI